MPRQKTDSYGSEDVHQQALFNFFAVAENRIPALELAFHTPNGGLRARKTAVKLKSLGVKPGVPDVMIPCANAFYKGLAIELKYGNNRCSSAQLYWHQKLREHGWRVAVVYDWTHAAAIVCEYFEVDPEDFGLHAYKESTDETA